MYPVLEKEPICTGFVHSYSSYSFEVYMLEGEYPGHIQERKALFVSEFSVSFCLIKKGISVIELLTFDNPETGGLKLVYSVPQGESGFDHAVPLTGKVESLRSTCNTGETELQWKKPLKS